MAYIDKKDLYKLFEESNGIIRLHIADVDILPTADVVEVKHGEWKHTVEKGNVYNHHFFNCSLCGASAFTSGYEKYCHEYGAKMDGRSDT